MGDRTLKDGAKLVNFENRCEILRFYFPSPTSLLRPKKTKKKQKKQTNKKQRNKNNNNVYFQIYIKKKKKNLSLSHFQV